MKIGIFGGTFNPVHNGHFNCLVSVMNKMKFDKMIVLPDRIPPHKQAVSLASGEDRLNMCKLAFNGVQGVECSDWELKQAGKSYTVLTLRHFKKKYPNDKLFFLMGSDMLLSFDKWYCYEEILSLATLVCVSRKSEDTCGKLAKCADKLMAVGGEVVIVETEPIEISSSQIRDKIFKNLDYTCYLNKNVVQYISERNLYNRGFIVD